MGERDDELLEEIPETAAPNGFTGYRSGAWLRRSVFGLVAVTVVTAIAVGVWWARKKEAEHRTPAVTYRTPDLDSPGRMEATTDELVWSSGPASLGLSRAKPGVSLIRLPDRVVRLAEGYDSAHIRVDVRDGKTVKLEAINGHVVVELTEPAAPQPDPVATPRSP